MINKIKEIIKYQIKLIEPLIKHGSTASLKLLAYNEVIKLENILESEKSDSVDFIKEYKSSIISCCQSIYNQLNIESRSLPTQQLRELAKKESINVMEIWLEVEKTEFNY